MRISKSFMKKSKDVSFEGDGATNEKQESLLATSERVVEIACGGLHTLVLTNRNRVLATGFGDTYALGIDKPMTICSFKEVNWFAQNFNYSDSSIEKLSCGVSHSGCIISGKLYVWGILGLNQEMHYKTPTLINLPISSGVFGNSYQNIHASDISNIRKSVSNNKSELPNLVVDLKLGDL